MVVKNNNKIVKISVLCTRDGAKEMVPVYVGNPSPDLHPIAFQKKFIEGRGYAMDQGVLDALSELHAVCKTYRISLPELCIQEFGKLSHNCEIAKIIEREVSQIPTE